MIYTNKRVISTKRKVSWGEVSVIAMGQYGRWCRQILIHCPEEIILGTGENFFSIGVYSNGHLKLVPEDGGYYFLLDTRFGYADSGNGEIIIPKSQRTKIIPIAFGNGADGLDTCQGTWDVAVLRLVEKCQIFCWLSGRKYNRLIYGIIFDFDPSFEGQKIKEVPLYEAHLYGGDFVPEIAEIVEKETANNQAVSTTLEAIEEK